MKLTHRILGEANGDEGMLNVQSYDRIDGHQLVAV